MIGEGIGDSEFARLLGERFEILSLLGQGGMGTVFRARDRESGREVALKIAQPDPGGTNRSERFRREGELTARLNHSGIVRVHTSGELLGRRFLTYELVEESQDLLEACRQRDVRPRVELVRDAARALGHAHAQGVVHRDVKPQNILVDGAGRVRVADFGLAWAQDQDRITRTGAALGTAHYMSPEQVGGGREIGPPADVWSLGVVLFQVLSDDLPFVGDTFMEVVAQICQGTPRPLRGSEPALKAICARALRRDPARRYADGAELADDLERYLAGEPVAASAEREPILARGWSFVKRGRWWLVPLAGSLAMLALAFTIPTRLGSASQIKKDPAPSPAPRTTGNETPVRAKASAAASPERESQETRLFLYQARRGCEEGDLISAEAMYRRAIREGSVVARVELAGLVSSGLVVAKGAAAARTLLREAAQAGNAQARALLAARPDPLAEADRLLERAANGERGAIVALARLLRDRLRSWPGFVHWALRAAKGPLTDRFVREAREDLMLHHRARYAAQQTPMNGQRLVRWTRRAAEAGSRLGLKAFADLLRRGALIKPDAVGAVRWLEQAAKLGDGEAMVTIGEMLLVGREVPRDEQAARQWLRKAANSADPAGLYQLGLIYRDGRADTKVDVRLAANYFHKAAQRGEPRGMLEYGKLIHAGKLPRQPRKLGRVWIKKAATLGYAPAKKLLVSLGERP